MRFLSTRCVQLAIGLFLGSCFAQVAEHQTTVKPRPEEEILNPCEYRMVLPETAGPVAATWIIFDRGQDYLKWYQDRQVRAFSREHRLALVLATHCRSKEREDMIVLPEKGVGRTLFTAIDQFADATAHPELKTARVIVMGWSGAGSLAARLAGYRPERYLAGIAYAPGQYEPLGMDTIQLAAGAWKMPQLIIANGGDNINGTERPYDYFKKYFELGAPWTFVVQNRTPHCCLQNAQMLILDWLHGVLSGSTTDKATKYGFLTIEFSDVKDDWKRPVFNAKSSRVGAKESARHGETPAGWMPTDAFAEGWLAFENRANPIAVWKP